MPHYAEIVNDLVVNVIYSDNTLNTLDFLSQDSEWIETCPNCQGGLHLDSATRQPDGLPSLRKNFASIGYHYHRELDFFYPPKPYENWQLNLDTGLWDPPVSYPLNSGEYFWDENTKQWSLVHEH